jgi:hypothetical protein
MASRSETWIRRVGWLLGILAAGALGLYVVGRLLFPVKVVHTTERSVVEERIKMKLDGASRTEGYFVHGFRVWLCWARFEVDRPAFESILRLNRMEGLVRAPWGSPARIQRNYGSPGVEGHQPEDAERWVATDFVPEGEVKQFSSSLVFGSRKGKPGNVFVYISGCPRDTNVIAPPEQGSSDGGGPG